MQLRAPCEPSWEVFLPTEVTAVVAEIVVCTCGMCIIGLQASTMAKDVEVVGRVDPLVGSLLVI